MKIAGVTDKQIEEAKNISLLNYFQSTNPSVLKQQGNGRIVHREHDSFVIDNGRNGQWFWNSQGVGGNSAVDYLMRIENMSFVDAVKELVSDGIDVEKPETKAFSSKPTPPQDIKKPFVLPTPAIDNNRMIAYLKSRGISEETTQELINKGLIYESQNGSCVFVGYDCADDNKPKYAAERSIDGDSKKDALGSDKAFSFCIPPKDPTSNAVAVFESALDAVSHLEIAKLSKADNKKSWDGHRLSLAGNATLALTSFLERNPHIENVYLCLDCDTTGKTACERIIKDLQADSRFADKKITVAASPIGKDFNDSLIVIRKLMARTENNGMAKKVSHIKE